MHDARLLDSGELLIEALVLVREAFVVDAERVQQRGLQIAHVHRVVDDVVGEFVGLAVPRSRP